MELINTYVINKTSSSKVQFFRHIVAGGIATVIDMGILFFVTEFLNIYYLISAGIAFLIANTSNYIFNTKWVFSERKFEDKKVREFMIFAVIGLIGMGINVLILWLITEYLGVYYMISKLMATIGVLFWNFIARKKLLFS
jgi:putative flippase GtrA